MPVTCSLLTGRRLRANAGRDRTHDRAYYEKLMSKLDSRIEQLLVDCETTDQTEEDTSSYVAMDKELAQEPELERANQRSLGLF